PSIAFVQTAFQANPGALCHPPRNRSFQGLPFLPRRFAALPSVGKQCGETSLDFSFQAREDPASCAGGARIAASPLSSAFLHFSNNNSPALLVAFTTALISVTRSFPSSSSRIPSIVHPAGVVTESFSSAGWSPVSSTTLAEPFIICAASSVETS